MLRVTLRRRRHCARSTVSSTHEQDAHITGMLRGPLDEACIEAPKRGQTRGRQLRIRERGGREVGGEAQASRALAGCTPVPRRPRLIAVIGWIRVAVRRPALFDAVSVRRRPDRSRGNPAHDHWSRSPFLLLLRQRLEQSPTQTKYTSSSYAPRTSVHVQNEGKARCHCVVELGPLPGFQTLSSMGGGTQMEKGYRKHAASTGGRVYMSTHQRQSTCRYSASERGSQHAQKASMILPARPERSLRTRERRGARRMPKEERRKRRWAFSGLRGRLETHTARRVSLVEFLAKRGEASAKKGADSGNIPVDARPTSSNRHKHKGPSSSSRRHTVVSGCGQQPSARQTKALFGARFVAHGISQNK
ncbi:hypothetical protein EDB84DRAFT_1680698 [Lactarius hengduanensis]|nr:hypothetical protein EDB84DRAFT_1680698 [Lactarius hengduanensis]